MTKDNPPAFARAATTKSEDRYTATAQEGMTLRDYFAGQALAGLLAHRERGLTDMVAQEAYEFADAMLDERESTNE